MSLTITPFPAGEQDPTTRVLPRVAFPVLDAPPEPDAAEPWHPWWAPIEEVLSSWTSVDGGSPSPCMIDHCAYNPSHDGHTHWDDVLTWKRRDILGSSYYRDIRFSLLSDGFFEPLQAWRTGASPSGFQWGEGHHRFTIMLDACFTHVPVHICDYRNCTFC